MGTDISTGLKALGVGAGLALITLVLFILPLRFVVGPEFYAGTWQLADQLAFGQLVGALFTVALAGAFGWYAIAQYLLAHIGRSEQQAAEQRRLVDALETLKRSLAHNRTQFQGLSQILAASQAPFDPQLDIATWDAVHLDVVPFLHDPDLAAAVAQHFAAVQSISELFDRYFEFTAGMTQAIGGAEQTAAGLKGYLLARMGDLHSRAQQLEARMEQAIAIRADAQRE